MKETIYTIPVNDAFGKKSECALCELQKNLEKSNIEYVLGAALMEPDVRIEMNKKGFCRNHYSDLVKSEKNSLGYSLILTSHHETLFAEIEKKVSRLYDKLEGVTKPRAKADLSRELADRLLDVLARDATSCFICDRIDYTMEKYFDVIFHMWKTSTVFRSSFIASKGFCNKHGVELLEKGKNSLKGESFSDFICDIYVLFISNWKRNEEDLRWFSKKFDYRYKDEPWKDSRDALKRFTEKITSFID